MRSKDIGELIDAASKVYCAHTVRVAGPARNVDGQLQITDTPQPLVQLSFGAIILWCACEG
jgi:hypothetical protein